MTPTSNIISLIQIGGTDLSASDGIDDGIREELWDGLFQNRIAPQVEAGIWRIMLWAPGGYEPGKPINFTQPFDAVALAAAYGDLSEPPAELIIYLGQIPRDPVLRNSRAGGWLKRVASQINVLANFGFSLAFDNVDDLVSRGNPVEELLCLLKALGVKVYTEPRIPKSKDSRLHGFDAITVASDFEKYPKEYFSDDVDHILMLTGDPPPSFGMVPKTDDEWNDCIRAWSPKVRANNCTPCFNINAAIRAGGPDAIREFIASC